MLREKDHACFKPCIKLALILTIGWSPSPFIIEPRLSHFKVHPIPIQLWVGPPFKSSVISTAAFQWELSDYVTTGPRKIDEMFLHCTKLTLDYQPLHILDPLPSIQHLNGCNDSPLYFIDPPHSKLEICAGNIRPMITDCWHAQEISAPWSHEMK